MNIDNLDFFKAHLLNSIDIYLKEKTDDLIRIEENNNANILRGRIFATTDIKKIVEHSYKESRARRLMMTTQIYNEGN